MPIRDPRYWWKKIRQQIGMPHLRVHDLRHQVGSLLGDEGFAPTIIQRYLGHTQISTSMRYVHLSSDPMRKASQRVSEIIDEAERAARRGPHGPETTTGVD